MPFGDTPAFDRGIDRGVMMPVGELITSSLSNKGNPTGFGQDNTFRVREGQEIRLVDNGGKVLFSGSGPEGAKQAVALGQAISDEFGNKAGWLIQTGERTINTDGSVGPTRYYDVAREKVNPTTGQIALQVLNTAAQIGVAVATSGMSIPAQAGIAGATAATLTLAQGGNLGDAIKSGVMAAVPVVGADKLGPIINKGLNTGSQIVGKSIGAGVSSAAAAGLTGQSLEDSLKSGVISAATTAITPDIKQLVKGIGGTNVSGSSSGGGNGAPITVTAAGTPGIGFSSLNSAPKVSNVDADGNIIVTAGATPGVGIGSLPSSPNFADLNVPKDILDLANLTEDGTDILVNAAQTAGIGGSSAGDGAVKSTGGGELPENLLVESDKTGATGGGSNAGDGAVKSTGGGELPENLLVESDKTGGTGGGGGGGGGGTDTKYVPPGDEIIVRAPPQPPVAPPIVIPPTFEPPPTTPPKKKWTWKDWVRLGLLAPTAIKGLGELIKGEDTQTIIPDRSAVTYTPLNRQRGVGTFDPFTYGQAGPGYQTAEFEYFKPYTEPKVTQTNVPFSVQTVAGTPTYQYTPEQVEAKNAEAMNTYNQNVAKFNAYQDTLAQQVEAGTITLADAIAQANTFGAGIGGIAPVPAADGGYIGYADGGEADDDMVSHLIEYRKGGGHDGPGRVKGVGSGQDDKIPAWLSDGEYVWSAQDVADLGDGSTDEGVRRLDRMRQMVRKQAGRKDVKKIAKPQKGIDHMIKAVRKQARRKNVKKIAKPQKGIDHMLKSVGGVV
jgi:hypothetical protein